MKANEAPEKIWIDNLDEGFWFDSPSGNKSIEYVRKDAFIDKAAKWIKDKAESYVVETSLCSYFDYKRAVEDFKEAMKL